MAINYSLSRILRIIASYPTRVITIGIAITFFLAVTSGWNALISYHDFNDVFVQEFQSQFHGNQNAKLALQNRLVFYQQDSLGRVLDSLFRLFFMVPLWIIILQIVKRNLCDRKTIQENLQLSEERANATLLALPDLVFRVNSDGEYLEFLTSPRDRQVVDEPRRISTSIYQDLQVDILPDHTGAKHTAIQQALITQTLQSYEQEVWLGDKLRYEEVRVTPCGDHEVVFFIRDISDRKLAEKSLLESKQFIQTILDTIPIPLFWKDRTSVFLGCNQKFVKNLGLSSEEIIGRTDFDLSPTEAEAISYRKDDQQVMEFGESRLAIEETLTLPSGEQRWLETHKAPLRDWQDKVIGMVGMFQDVTERRQSKERLQQQLEKEYLLSAVTKRIRTSLDLEEILHTTVEEVRHVLQSDRALVCKIAPDLVGSSIIAEAVLPHCQKSLNIVFPEGVISEEAYNYYRQGNIVVINDRDNQEHIILSPPVIEFLIQIQVQAVVAVPIIHDQILWGLLVIQQCDHPRQWQDWEIDLLSKTTDQLAIAIQQANLFERSQTELAERQRAETQLTEINSQLEIVNEELIRATRLKDEFLANMSHELRTPLNAILGMTEGLQEEIFGIVNERQIKALQTVERSSNHLLSLINDILDVAKVESGQIELDYSLVSISHLCQSSVVFVKQQSLTKHIQLKVKLAQNLFDLWIDERRIRQVLINLLNNAVKFTPEGGCITLEVTQFFRNRFDTDVPQQCFLRIAVIDTGIGICSENIKKLFQPFIQIDNALNREHAGTGLGLALVKRIVELHGGQVGLTSELGAGSCFSIDLPYPSDAFVCPITTTGDTPTDAIPMMVSSPVVDPSSLILLAEDNAANIMTFSSYLEAKGYRILLANHGQEAIEMAIIHQPDLILMDIQMPGIDGLEATKQIRLFPSLISIPIIALTAMAMKGDREKCLGAGANEYLAKPVNLKQLTTTIHQLLAV